MIFKYLGCAKVFNTSVLASKHLLHLYRMDVIMTTPCYNVNCYHNLGATFFFSPYKKFTFIGKHFYVVS